MSCLACVPMSVKSSFGLFPSQIYKLDCNVVVYKANVSTLVNEGSFASGVCFHYQAAGEGQCCVTNQENPYVWFEMMNPEALRGHRLIMNTKTVIIGDFSSPKPAAC